MPSMINPEDFEKIQDPNLKLNIVFQYTSDIYRLLQKNEENCEGRLGECNTRFKKLENRKRIDMTISGVFGFIGGFVSGAAKSIFKL